MQSPRHQSDIQVVYTHTSKPVCEQDVDTVLWNQGVHTDKLQHISQNNNEKIKRENVHTGRCGSTCRQKCCAKGSRKETKTQELMCRDITNVEHEM